MEEEIIELKEEIDMLTERIQVLEKKENKRKALIYGKILVKIILLLVTAYGIWQGYEYVVKELPKIMDEKIKEINPIKNSTIESQND